MLEHENVDWARCPLVEILPRVQSGAPVLLGTRLPVSAVVDNYADGLSVDEIAEQFETPVERVQEIVTYYESHRIAHTVR